MADMFYFNSPISTQVDRRRRTGHSRTSKNNGRRRSTRTDQLHPAAQYTPGEGGPVHSDDTTATMSTDCDRTNGQYHRSPRSDIDSTVERGQRGVSSRPPLPSWYFDADTAALEEPFDYTSSHTEASARPVPDSGIVLTNNPLESPMQVDYNHDQPAGQYAALSSRDQQASIVEPTNFPNGMTSTTPQIPTDTALAASTTRADLLLQAEGLDPPPSQFRPNTPEGSPELVVLDSQLHLFIDSTFSEDAWPVDDRRRTYDYSDFVATWMECSAKDLFPTEPGPRAHQFLRRLKVLEQTITPSCVSQNVDMQGIEWNGTYPSREQALQARRYFHPRRTTDVYSRYGRSPPAPEANAPDQYSFRNFVPRHRAKFSHYQLRNMLAAAGRHDIFYAAKGKVWQTSLSCPTVANTVLDYSKTPERTDGFQFTCLSAHRSDRSYRHAADNVLIAGGFNGEFILLNTDRPGNPSAIEGTVTHAHNGLVTHVHQFENRQSGLPQAFFCSNEGEMRLMDIRTLQFTNTFSCDAPINCSATSADRRLRALVGDTKDAFITDADEGRVLVTLRQHSDYGFACAWSDDGRYVATAAQDDTVAVWDARKWSRPLVVQPTVMSCARSLHFTHSGALVVAENEDIVSIYGRGVFNRSQDLQFFGSIAGVALVNGGEEIVVANCDHNVGGLMTFELSSSWRSGLHHRQNRETDWGLLMP